MSTPLATQDTDELHRQLCLWLNAIGSVRDKQAFSQLFKWFAPKIKQFGFKQFNSEAQAMELVQETMTNIWRKSHLYDQNKSAPTTWLYSIMRNMSFDMLRKIQTQREETISDDIWSSEQFNNILQTPVFQDHLLEKNINNSLENLPKNQQQIIVGLYYQQATQEQLAQQLNLPIGTIKSRLRLALNKLRQQLGETYD
ncbi:sigma-70 family RNA polymerase sigma factor [Alteromonadaceae bacterium BrNp21-10]|nr:sigma-70 family RNA polymerase sigma factor [Alteromonadaceae bacterium BrNp21-10]